YTETRCNCSGFFCSIGVCNVVLRQNQYMVPRILLLALVFGMINIQPAHAKGSKSDKGVIKTLKADIGYLASEELEGRRVGSEGELKAGAYLEKRYTAIGIPGYKGKYSYPFPYIDGKQIMP